MTGSEPSALPETCAVAFKEWDGVCAALTSGRQSLILRKGGIEEGPGGFTPEHRAFWLFPTRVHQAEQGLKPGASPPGTEVPEGNVAVRSLAVVDFIGRADNLDALNTLDDLHVWTPETVAKRFHYRHAGLWVLAVRVLSREVPAVLRVTPEQAGCKSWVTLESPLRTAGLTDPVADEEFARRLGRVRAALGSVAGR